MKHAGSPGSGTKPGTPESLGSQRARKEARRQEILDAIKTCKIHLSDRELRLMTRELDQDFLRREAEAHAEFERQKRARRSKGSPRSGSPGLLQNNLSRDPLLSDTAKAKLEDADFRIKRQSGDVKLLRSALNDLQHEQGVPLEGALHPDNRRHRALMNRTRKPPGGTNVATSTEEERQQLLVANAIARVKARQKTSDNRLKELFNVAIALSGREQGSPKATDRYVTDSEELRLIFKEIDDDDSGYLDKTEVGVLFERLGVQLSSHDIDDVMQVIDDDRSGAVNVIEFEEYWREHVEAKAPPGTLPEATSRAYKYFAREYKPICEKVRREDAVLIRAAGGTDAVIRYAWTCQSAVQKMRWANSSRTAALRKETRDLQQHGLTRFNTTYDRAPTAHMKTQANWRHRGMVGSGAEETMSSSTRLKQVADPNDFLRGTSPYRVAMKEGAHEGPTQGYPQEITDALNSTITSVDSISTLPSLAGAQPHVYTEAESVDSNGSVVVAGLDPTVNAGRLGSLLVDVSDRGMDLLDMKNAEQNSRVFASPASSFGSGLSQQDKTSRLGVQQSDQMPVFSSHSMPDLPATSSASTLKARRRKGKPDGSAGSSAFASRDEMCRPAPALLRGRPVALRMVPSSLQRERLRKQPMAHPYSFASNSTGGPSPRFGVSHKAHWSEKTYEPSSVSVSYV